MLYSTLLKYYHCCCRSEIEGVRECWSVALNFSGRSSSNCHIQTQRSHNLRTWSHLLQIYATYGGQTDGEQGTRSADLDCTVDRSSSSIKCNSHIASVLAGSVSRPRARSSPVGTYCMSYGSPTVCNTSNARRQIQDKNRLPRHDQASTTRSPTNNTHIYTKGFQLPHV